MTATLKLIACERLSASLTRSSCATRYRTANSAAHPDARFISCRGCAVGKRSAVLVPVAAVSRKTRRNQWAFTGGE